MPSAGVISPDLTTICIPMLISVICISERDPSSLSRCAMRGTRDSNSLSSLSARLVAHNSRSRPVASINAITAEAKYSASAKVATMVSKAKKSDPNCFSRIETTSHLIDGINPATPPRAQRRSDADEAPARLSTHPMIRASEVPVKRSMCTGYARWGKSTALLSLILR